MKHILDAAAADFPFRSRVCFLRRILLSICCVATFPALAADLYGYWAVNAAPDGVKLGVIFPEYSTNDFAGLSFTCVPGTQDVQLVADGPQTLKKGAVGTIEIGTGEERATYKGRAETSEMDDGVRVVASTTLADPVFRTLARGQSIPVNAAGQKMVLPSRGAPAAIKQFLGRCGG